MEVYWSRASQDVQEGTKARLLAAGRFCLPELGDEKVWVWAEGAGWSSEPVKVRTALFADRDLVLRVSQNARLLVSWLPPDVASVELDLYGELTIGSRNHLVRLSRRAVAQGGLVELPRHRPIIVVAHARRENGFLAPQFLRIGEEDALDGLQLEAVLQFQTSSRYQGMVATSEDEAVEGVTVVAWLTTPASELPFRIQSSQTDHDGHYELTGLPAGDYELVVREEGFLETRQWSELGAEEVRDVDLALLRGERVSGVVVETGNGRPLAGAHVQLIKRGMRSTWTGADGRFFLEGVRVGAFSVKANVPGRRQAHERVVVEQGREADLRIESPSGTRWITRVVGFSGVPNQIAILRASEYHSAPVAADGRFVLENGPDGLVGFTLTAADGSLICTGGVEVPRGGALMSSDVSCRSGSETEE